LNTVDNVKLRHSIRVICGPNSTHIGEELKNIEIIIKEELVAEEQSKQFYVLKLDRLSKSQAVSIKTDLISAGVNFALQGEFAGGLSMIAAGSRWAFEKLAYFENCCSAKDVPAILQACLSAIENYVRTCFVVPYPGGELDLSRRTAVMGVLNVTPDSFSDGGDFFPAEAAVEHALEMAEAGADIIDIGGESTRPGSDPVSSTEEIRRVVPVIEAIHSKVSVPVSIDTYKPEVAREALSAGAKIVNDVTGLRENGEMAEVVAEHGVPVMFMHMKGKPKSMQDNPVYEDLIHEIYSSLAGSVEAALAHGIGRDKLIVDPGIGFGKSFADNLIILDRLHEFRSLGLPICVGVSRKSFLGATLGVPEPKKRLSGGIAASVIAVRGGAKIVRTHDVRETAEAVKVADAIEACKLPQEA
jgi:dihydropteroate synthase